MVIRAIVVGSHLMFMGRMLLTNVKENLVKQQGGA